MKTKFLMAILTALVGISMSASAEFYASVGIGSSFNDGSVHEDDIRYSFKNSPIYSIAGGYELPLPLFDVRGELEYIHSNPDVKTISNRKLDGLMANAYVDIPFVPIVDPYVGLGLGKVRFDHTNSFAVQGMLGLEYEVPILPVAVGAEYRYFKINETTGKGHTPSKYHTNILMMKARYLF